MIKGIYSILHLNGQLQVFSQYTYVSSNRILDFLSLLLIFSYTVELKSSISIGFSEINCFYLKHILTLNTSLQLHNETEFPIMHVDQ